MVYYNENDPKTAAWLKELIKAGLVANGEVDERSIELVQPGDVRGFVQCHFFAGIGGWSYALRLAGWPDGRHVWTGSCPCQPFSSAGAQAGGDDPRHLWPAWFRLIRECRPYVVFGEQVENAIVHGWIDLVCDDLEGEGYAAAPIGLPAACVGAFHGRPRVWFVADSCGSERGRRAIARPQRAGLEHIAVSGELGNADEPRSQGRSVLPERANECVTRPASLGGVAIANERGSEVAHVSIRPEGQEQAAAVERGASFWSAADWIPCADGAFRPVEPGTFPLAHGIPARVGRLRGYGNAIVPQVAAEFIAAYCEARGELTCLNL